MARYQQQRNVKYPIGSKINGTMRLEDLIPSLCDTLNWLAAHLEYGDVSKQRRVDHQMMFIAVMDQTEETGYYDSETADADLQVISDMLQEYAGPYFYFGAHPDDSADYGYWLSETWDEDFDGLRVSDLSEVPAKYRGAVAVVNDHGNVTLYVKTSRTLRAIWAVV